jgi:hypothetical protein
LWLGGKYEDGGATFLGYSYDADLSRDMENASIAGCPYGFSLMNLRPKKATTMERVFVDNTQKMPYVTLDMPLTFDSIDLIDYGKQADKGAVQKNGSRLNESEEEEIELELTKEDVTEIVKLALEGQNDTILALGKKLDDYIKTGEESPEQEWEKDKTATLTAYKTVKLEAANLGKKPEELMSLVPGTTVKEIDDQVAALQAMRETHKSVDHGDGNSDDDDNKKKF